MAWDDALLPASFRGIPFFVDNHEHVGGRNAISHEPPDRDKSFAEDIGKKHDGYKITGHVIGDTYFFIRDALISAMTKKDPGILIHPYLGLVDVQPAEFRFSEDTKEGRICRFELNFVEAGDPNTVFGVIDDFSKMVATVVATVAAIENAFATVAVLTGLPSYVLDSAEAVLVGFVGSVRDSVATIKADGEELSNIEQRLATFEANVRDSFKDPASIAAGVDEIVENLKDVPAEAQDDETIDTTAGRSDDEKVFDELLDNADAEEAAQTETEPTTDTRAQEQVNNLAIVNMIRQTVICRKAEVLVDKSYGSVDDALASRNGLVDLIDAQLILDNLDDDLFQALKDLKAIIVKLIPNVGQALNTIKTIEQNSTLPAIVISYNQTGTLDIETDIVDRNKVANPCFVSGTLEVVNV